MPRSRLDLIAARRHLWAMRCTALLLLTSLPLPVIADELPGARDPRISVAFGAFCQVASVDSVAAPDAHGEKIELLPNVPVIRWPGTRVPALPGVSFGVRSITASGEVLSPVLIELFHPPFTASGRTEQRYVTTLGGAEPSINAYSFDSLEELVTGTWTLRAWHDGVLLYDVPFDVVPPEFAPGIGRDCAGEHIS